MAQLSITINPDLLKFKMKVTGHTLKTLSKETGLSTKQISRIRKNGQTTPQSLKKLAEKLGCEPSELQNQYLIPQHKSWGVFTGLGKHNDTGPLLLENGWYMEHINNWQSLADSIDDLNNRGIIQLTRPQRPSTPKMEKARWEKGDYHKTSTTITSTNDAVQLIIQVYSFENSLLNSVKIVYKPGMLTEYGLTWEHFYNDNIFSYNDKSMKESDLLVKKIADSVCCFSDELYINNHAIAADEEDIVYVIQSMDTASNNCIGHQMFSSMYELEVALVGYLSELDTEKSIPDFSNEPANEVDSHFNLDIMFTNRESGISNGIANEKYVISKLFKNDDIYQEACWNKTEKNAWKKILIKSMAFDPDAYEALCESYELPESTLSLDIEKQITIKTISDFIDECNH